MGNITVSRASDDDIATITDVTLVRPGCFLATLLGSAVFVRRPAVRRHFRQCPQDRRYLGRRSRPSHIYAADRRFYVPRIISRRERPRRTGGGSVALSFPRQTTLVAHRRLAVFSASR